MPGIAEVLLRIKAQDQASRTIEGVAGKARALGQTMGRALRMGAIAGGAAMAGAGVAAIKMGMDFEKGMSEVRTLMPQLGEAGFQQLQKDVLALSKEMGVATDQMVPALYQAVSAGVEVGDAMKFMEENAKLAVGGVTELATAVDLTTTILNAFGMQTSEVGRVSDVMFTAVKLGKTTVGELGAAIFNVAPAAAAFGVSVEEVAAALAVLTAQGTPTTEATTQLRQAIMALAAPTVRQAKILEELGVSIDKTKIEANGLGWAFEQIRVAAKGDDAMMRRLLGSQEAVMAALGLSGENAEAFAAALNETESAAGAANTAYETMNETFSRQFGILKNQVVVMLTELGLKVLPRLTDVVSNTLIPAVERFTDWLEGALPRAVNEARRQLLVMKTGFEDIATAAKNFGDWVIHNQAAIIAAIIAIGAAFVWTHPLIAVFAAAGGLIWAIGLFKKNIEDLSPPLREVRAEIDRFILTLTDLLDGMAQVADMFMSMGTDIIPGWKTPLDEVQRKIGELRQSAVDDLYAIGLQAQELQTQLEWGTRAVLRYIEVAGARRAIWERVPIGPSLAELQEQARTLAEGVPAPALPPGVSLIDPGAERYLRGLAAAAGEAANTVPDFAAATGGAGAATAAAAEQVSDAEQALLDLTTAFNTAGLTGQQYQDRLAIVAEGMDRFNLSAEEMLATLQVSGLAAGEFARHLEALVVLERLRDQADAARGAVDALYDAFNRLLGAPTREEAVLRLRVARLEERRAEARLEDAGEEVIEALDKQIDAIRREMDVRRAHQDVLRAQLDLANRMLITDRQQQIFADILITRMGETSGAAAGLRDQLFIATISLNMWTRAMTDWMGQARNLVNAPSFHQGGVMPYTGAAWLEKGERVSPADHETPRQGNTFYGSVSLVLPGVRGAGDLWDELDRRLR